MRDKLAALNAFIAKELDVLELGKKIQSDVQEELGKNQREYYLREQLKAIQRELGEGQRRKRRSASCDRRSTNPACRRKRPRRLGASWIA